MDCPTTPVNKKQWRKNLKKKRADLSLSRRETAEISLLKTLTSKLPVFSYVLSFASFHTEISTEMLNLYLCRSGRLVLPKMSKDGLKLFEVLDLKKQLTTSALGIKEPLKNLCREISLHEINVALIPGLGFDKNNNRMGYGKGLYDRLLSARHPKVQTFGVGFKEQLVPTLPKESHDISLNKLYLF